MNGVRVARCECDHLCTCHSQTKKFRAKSVTKTTRANKNWSTAKHELPLKHYVEIVSTTACARNLFIGMWWLYPSVASTMDRNRMKLHTAHWTLQNRFKIYLVIVLSHRSKFSSIPFSSRCCFFAPEVFVCRHETKKNKLIVNCLLLFTGLQEIERKRTHIQNILANISSAPNIDALWVAAAKKCTCKNCLYCSFSLRIFFRFISVKIDKNQLNTLFFLVVGCCWNWNELKLLTMLSCFRLVLRCRLAESTKLPKIGNENYAKRNTNGDTPQQLFTYESMTACNRLFGSHQITYHPISVHLRIIKLK